MSKRRLTDQQKRRISKQQKQTAEQAEGDDNKLLAGLVVSCFGNLAFLRLSRSIRAWWCGHIIRRDWYIARYFQFEIFNSTTF